MFFYFLIALLLQAAQVQAREFEKIPEQNIEEIFVTAEDGVTTKLYHLKNPGKPILLLEPGLGAQAMSLEIPATAFYLRGQYDIFIGNWRGSVRLPERYKGLGERNGLPEVVRKDFPAHLRHILNNYATPEQRAAGISLFGHSMGGMMIMGTLSDPQLAAEFKPHIKSIVLFQSPHHVGYLKGSMKGFAKIGAPALSALKERGIKTLDLHSRFLVTTHDSKQKGGWFGRFITPAVENWAIALTRLALSPVHTGRQGFRRAFFKMSAWGIPIDLLADFAKAVNSGGQFVDSQGQPLIRPEAVRDIPIQVVRTRLDTLAPWAEQAEYFNELGAHHKQLLNVSLMNHIDSVLFTREGSDFLDHVIDFFKAPVEQATRNRELEFKPYCESLLTKLKLTVRLRGI